MNGNATVFCQGAHRNYVGTMEVWLRETVGLLNVSVRPTDRCGEAVCTVPRECLLQVKDALRSRPPTDLVSACLPPVTGRGPDVMVSGPALEERDALVKRLPTLSNTPAKVREDLKRAAGLARS